MREREKEADGLCLDNKKKDDFSSVQSSILTRHRKTIMEAWGRQWKGWSIVKQEGMKCWIRTNASRKEERSSSHSDLRMNQINKAHTTRKPFRQLVPSGIVIQQTGSTDSSTRFAAAFNILSCVCLQGAASPLAYFWTPYLMSAGLLSSL